MTWVKTDLTKAIAANLPAGTYPIVLFIPSRDRFGSKIDCQAWTREALRVLGTQFRGATGLPGFGVWRDDEQGGILVEEEPVIVFCFADPKTVTLEAAKALREFLHRMGREAQQGEVGAVIAGKYWGITNYDEKGA